MAKSKASQTKTYNPINEGMRKDIEAFKAWTKKEATEISKYTLEERKPYSQGFSAGMKTFRKVADTIPFLAVLIGTAKSACLGSEILAVSVDGDPSSIAEANATLLYDIVCGYDQFEHKGNSLFFGNKTIFNENVQTLFGILNEDNLIDDYICYLCEDEDADETYASDLYIEGFLDAIGSVADYDQPYTLLPEEENYDAAIADGYTCFGKWENFCNWSMTPPWPIVNIFDEDQIAENTVDTVLKKIEELKTGNITIGKPDKIDMKNLITGLNYLEEWIKEKRDLLNPVILSDFFVYLGGAVTIAPSNVPDIMFENKPVSMEMLTFFGLTFEIYKRTYSDLASELLMHPKDPTEFLFCRQIYHLFRMFEAYGVIDENASSFSNMKNEVFSAMNTIAIVNLNLGLKNYKILTQDDRITAVADSFINFVYKKNHPDAKLSIDVFSDKESWNAFLKENGAEEIDVYYCR